MGLGDEIMALGRAEKIFEETGKPVSIRDCYDRKRYHDCWVGNPAVDAEAEQKIIDGAAARPYILHWKNRQAIFNLSYKARAGKVHLNKEHIKSNTITGRYAVISPYTKKEASPNKNWGSKKWEEVIKNFPIPVYQLIDNIKAPVIKGAIPFLTPHYKNALAVIKEAAIVLTNEGGTHHMAASMGRPAVVIFGSFVPPSVTGYDFHENIAIYKNHGFCGNWGTCYECQKSLEDIKPAEVFLKAINILRGENVIQ